MLWGDGRQLRYEALCQGRHLLRLLAARRAYTIPVGVRIRPSPGANEDRVGDSQPLAVLIGHIEAMPVRVSRGGFGAASARKDFFDALPLPLGMRCNTQHTHQGWRCVEQADRCLDFVALLDAWPCNDPRYCHILRHVVAVRAIMAAVVTREQNAGTV